MNPDWERQWITICIGIVTIATAAVGVALSSARLADLAVSATSPEALIWLYCRFITSLFVALIYLTLIRNAEAAIFATDFELARVGTNRREATRQIYQGLFPVLSGLLLLIALNVAQDLTSSLNTVAMPQTGDD